jgi:hypothetical protein
MVATEINVETWKILGLGSLRGSGFPFDNMSLYDYHQLAKH